MAQQSRDDAQTVVARFLPASLRGQYLNILLEKAASTPTPSISMLRRIQQIAQQM